MMADLIVIDIFYFDIILVMDWLSSHYATIDYLEKWITFQILGDTKFNFIGRVPILLLGLFSPCKSGGLSGRGVQHI